MKAWLRKAVEFKASTEDSAHAGSHSCAATKKGHVYTQITGTYKTPLDNTSSEIRFQQQCFNYQVTTDQEEITLIQKKWSTDAHSGFSLNGVPILAFHRKNRAEATGKGFSNAARTLSQCDISKVLHELQAGIKAILWTLWNYTSTSACVSVSQTFKLSKNKTKHTKTFTTNNLHYALCSSKLMDGSVQCRPNTAKHIHAWGEFYIH